MAVQRSVRMIQYENIPCFYKISFSLIGPAIIVKVNKDFMRFLLPKEKIIESPLKRSFMKSFSFSEFSPDLSGTSFGFDNAFKKTGEENDFISFSAKIPILEKPLFKTCTECGGNGETLFDVPCPKCFGSRLEEIIEDCEWCGDSGENHCGDPCFICKGKLKTVKRVMDWQPLYFISATFSLFFDLMTDGFFCEEKFSSDSNQLLFLETCISKQMGGAPIYGTYSIPLIEWLFKIPENSKISEVEAVMTTVHKRIFGKFDDIDKMNTWAQVKSKTGWLSINCSGDRCGIYPSHQSFSINEGYEFSCHNVDTPAQQLILLSGLAALCDKARFKLATMA